MSGAATTLVDLPAILHDVATELGRSPQDAGSLADGLDDEGLTSVDLIATYHFGSLLQDKNLPAAIVGTLCAKLLGDNAGHGLDESNANRTFVFKLLERCVAAYRTANAPEPVQPIQPQPMAAPSNTAAQSAEEKEAAETNGAYEDLAALQNRAVDLSDRSTFAGPARASVKKWGYINLLPPMKQLRTAGLCGTKRKLPVSSTGGLRATIELDDGTATSSPTDMPAMHRLARVYLLGVLASMSFKIGGAAYSGRGCGWVTASGTTGTVRLMMTAAAYDKLLGAVIGINTTNVDIFCTLFDGIMTLFTNELAKCEKHPDEIVDWLIDRKEKAFIPGEGDNASTVTSVGKSASEVGGDGPSGGSDPKGVCFSWLSNGKCNKDKCPYSHPSAHSGAFTSSRRGGRNNSRSAGWNGGGHHMDWGGGWGGNWNGGGWGHHNSHWGGKGKGNGKGKGKGKGKY